MNDAKTNSVFFQFIASSCTSKRTTNSTKCSSPSPGYSSRAFRRSGGGDVVPDDLRAAGRGDRARIDGPVEEFAQQLLAACRIHLEKAQRACTLARATY